MRLSVFDQSPVAAGQSQPEAIRDSLALAQAAEAMGYHRFWVSEHHSNATLAGSAPEILVAAIAAQTRRIRVGAAGILLSYYAPFKVAEQFRVLEAIAPGRIDLGVGRSPGGQGQEAALDRALRPGAWTPPKHDQALRDLLRWVQDAADAPHGVRALPQDAGAPDVWVLGGSCKGARLAAELGLPFAFNYSNGVLPDGAEAPLELYRRSYQPSAAHPAPYVALQVWALAADSAAEAEHHFRSRADWRIKLGRGVREPLQPPEQTLSGPLSAAEVAALEEMRRRHLVGAAGAVARELAALARRLGADELVIPTWTYDPAARLKSYALLADAPDRRSLGFTSPAKRREVSPRSARPAECGR